MDLMLSLGDSYTMTITNTTIGYRGGNEYSLEVTADNGTDSIIQENVIHSFNSEAGVVTWIPSKTEFKLINNSNAAINYNIIELKDLINKHAND